MAQSLPVVVTNLPALTEIVENSVTGIVTENNDLHSLVTSIEKLIQDSELREKLGKQAKIWVEKERSWDNLVAALSAGIY